MKNTWIHPSIPLWAIGGILSLLLTSCQPLATAPEKSPPPQTTPSAAPDDWPTYMKSIERSGFNAAETSISAATVSHLKLRWIDQSTSRVFSQPIVAHNLIFWGSGDGYEHATDLQGHPVWAANLGWSSSGCPGNGDDKNGVLKSPPRLRYRPGWLPGRLRLGFTHPGCRRQRPLFRHRQPGPVRLPRTPCRRAHQTASLRSCLA